MKLEAVLALAYYYGNEKTGEIVFELPRYGRFSLSPEDLQEVCIVVHFPKENSSVRLSSPCTLYQILASKGGEKVKPFPIQVDGEMVIKNAQKISICDLSDSSYNKDSESFQLVCQVELKTLEIVC